MKLWKVVSFLLLLALLISASSAVPITNCSISWSNIYGTTIYNISNAGTYDETSTENNITNIQNRYIYADSLSSSVSPFQANSVGFVVAGLVYNDVTISDTPQGSTSLISGNDVIQGYYWDFGDGTTIWGSRTSGLTHTYTSPGTYTTNLTLSNEIDKTGITLSTTFTLYAPVISNMSISPAYGGMTTLFTLSADVVNATSYQWQFSNDNISWNNIPGATSYTWSGYPSSVGDKYLRLLATNSGFTTTSNIITTTIYSPPTVIASLSPTSGPQAAEIALSASVTDPGPDTTTYQWQRSSDNTTWTNIGGATTKDYNLTITFPASGSQYFRLLAVGSGGTGTSNVIVYTAIAKPVFSSVNANPSVGELPFTTTLSASASDTTSYQWQQLIGVVWTNIGTGASITHSITTAGNIQIRVIATGPGGSTTSSTLTINSGGVPTVTINSPLPSAVYKINTSVTLSAEIVGADTFSWNFGDTEASGDTTANPTTVIYNAFGNKIITLTASNIYGTTTKTVTIRIGGIESRPTATQTLAPISTQIVSDLVDTIDNVEDGDFPDPVEIFFVIMEPYESIIGGFVMLLIFGVIFIMLWMITKNITVPSIIGIIFGVFILSYLPAAYYGPAIAIMAISITGGIIRVFKPPTN